jgi:hypothetical protein
MTVAGVGDFGVSETHHAPLFRTGQQRPHPQAPWQKVGSYASLTRSARGPFGPCARSKVTFCP